MTLRIDPSKDSRIKQFCPRKHNKDIVGRAKDGVCKACEKEERWAKYGIKNADGSPFTIVNFDYSYQLQQGRCKICNRHQSILKKTLAVDHSHETGIFRGLICDPCNRGLGFYESMKQQFDDYLK